MLPDVVEVFPAEARSFLLYSVNSDLFSLEHHNNTQKRETAVIVEGVEFLRPTRVIRTEMSNVFF